MKKIINIFLAESKFIIRQGYLLLLILLHPFFLILMLYPLFNISFELNSVSVGIFTKQETNFTHFVIGKLLKEEKIIFLKNERELENAIKKGKVNIGILLSDEKLVFIENPLKETANIYFIAKLYNNLIREVEKNAKSLSNLTSMLSHSIKNITYYKEELSYLRDTFAQFKSELEPLPEENFTKITEYLKTTFLFLDFYFNESIANTKKHLIALNNHTLALRNLKNEVLKMSEFKRKSIQKLNKSINKTRYYKERTFYALSMVRKLKKDIPPSNPIYENISKIEEKLNRTYADLKETEEDLKYTKRELEGINFSYILRELNTSLRNVTEVRKEINLSLILLNYHRENLNKKTNNFTRDLFLIKNIIKNISKINVKMKVLLSNTIPKIEKSLKQLNTSLSIINKILSYEKKKIIPPPMERKRLFFTKGVVYHFFPLIICLDILFISLLLPLIMRIKELEIGVEKRILHLVSPEYLILGRFFAYLLLILIQGLISFYFIVYLLHINISLSMYTLFSIFITAWIFASIGLLISTFFSNSASGILFTITLELFMILFSGKFIPFEFMPYPFSLFAKNLPLSLLLINLENSLYFHMLYLNPSIISYLLIPLLLSVLIYKFKFLS